MCVHVTLTCVNSLCETIVYVRLNLCFAREFYRSGKKKLATVYIVMGGQREWGSVHVCGLCLFSLCPG